MVCEGDCEMESLDGSDNFQVLSTRPATPCRQRRRCRCTRAWCFWNVCCPAGVVAVFALSLLVAAIVFVPWFMVGIRPDILLEESMEPTTCWITNHTVIDTRPVDGNTRLLYMPGLGVVVSLDLRAAVATARVERSDSWMSAEVMGDYFARHPVNATLPCYTNGERVAMRPGVDGIGKALGGCISITIIAFFTALLMFGVAASVLLTCVHLAMLAE
ncbi:hypothetical protein pclt_cds_1105 [Pandoravirus celtis]|uniref:Uncharacterized protein n=1 Tax=Pandoravirus celtis TaxID=2568002 RepID=A0A4D6EJM4_9VIRU|nr:hypothetical protein pclt_cds_1105 [Pandoravirus celtis]